MENEGLLNPAKFYEEHLRDAYLENAGKVFDELLERSGVDVEKSRAAAAAYEKDEAARKVAEGALGKARRLQAIPITLICLFGTAGLLLIFLTAIGIVKGPPVVFYVLGAIMLLAAASFGFIWIPINKRIRAAMKIFSEKGTVAEDALKEAYREMAPLNRIFDWNAPAEIVRRTTPLIKLDPYFDIHKLAYLKEKYGFGEEKDPDKSTVMTLSGEIVGNPFFLYKRLEKSMHMHHWTGSTVISYMKTDYDAHGRPYVHLETETLYASLDKPEPGYSYDTTLLYANDAAPKLHFSRAPSGCDQLSEKEIEKKVRRGAKQLRERGRKEILDKNPATNFTMMGNEKFDVLFGALDRDNEVEFRLLYTPIAQLSTLDLILKGKPYGDDFSIRKEGRLNWVRSKHSQGFDYSSAPGNYISYSIDIARKKFIEYNTRFISGLFFDLAPLLCIPLYQQYKPREYIYNDDKFPNYTGYEDEVLANSFADEVFLPPEATTRQILKATSRVRAGGSDVVIVTSHSYKGVPQVTIVPVMGGDGLLHDVPVHWIDYRPVQKDTSMAVKKCRGPACVISDMVEKNKALKELLGRLSVSFVHQRGLSAMVLKGGYGEKEDEALEKIYNPKTEEERMDEKIKEEFSGK